jgi:hypothetical protein
VIQQATRSATSKKPASALRGLLKYLTGSGG